MVGLVPTLMIVQVGMSQAHLNSITTTHNLTTHKDDTSATLGNTDSRPISEYLYDPEIQRDHAQGNAVVMASPIVIPAPPYRVDSVERYRMGYPASPASDDTRVGDIPY